ncbi:uncharacterized protein LTR77_006636 [Saxophila tyrrhenica]|uniref:NAD(P)-binding domain-containing protein n=1 Tax=Saxophila tyrrhenica TaxID=1690608 RepID=A0AAV9P974_9PEZI|nr:hypothetical protein LTR77_006636 [Saxophila tyrrhenica]
MRLVVLGGNGRTGVHLVDRALARGTPRKLEDVSKAFSGSPKPEAVIVTLNPSRLSDSPFSRPAAPPRFLAHSVANAITAMRQHDVKKLVVMQAMGVGDSRPHMSFWMRWVRRWTYMKHSYDDHDLVDEIVKFSGVSYVLARPPWLTDGKVGPVRTFGNTGKGVGNLATISRRSVTEFLLDACEKSDWDCSTPVIAS